MYKIGDRVTYNLPISPFTGAEVVVVGLLRTRDVVCTKSGERLSVACYKVTNPDPTKVARNIPVLPIHLNRITSHKPFRGDIDKIMTWAEGPWQPSNVNK